MHSNIDFDSRMRLRGGLDIGVGGPEVPMRISNIAFDSRAVARGVWISEVLGPRGPQSAFLHCP